MFAAATEFFHDMNPYSQTSHQLSGMNQEQPEIDIAMDIAGQAEPRGKTRDRLLAAGFKLLRRKHFKELSVADIARPRAARSVPSTCVSPTRTSISWR